MNRNTPTICSFCSNGCGMFIRTDGQEPIGVLPIRNHPISEGRLCHRGWNRFQNLRSLNRVTHPLVREGSQLKQVTWAEALGKVKDKISDFIGSYGPRSLGVIGSPWLTNEDNYVTSLFTRGVLTSQNLDGSYRFSGAAALCGLAALFPEHLGSLGSIRSLRENKGIVVCGRESLRDFSPVGSRIVQSHLAGGTIILADPSSQRAEHFYRFHLPYPLEVLASAMQEKGQIPEEAIQLLSSPDSALIFVADYVKQSSSLSALVSLLDQPSAPQTGIPNILPLSRSPNLRGAWDMGVKPGAEGLNLQEMLSPDSSIRGLLIFADDLLSHLPSVSMVEKLKGLEFIVVADRFVTETTQIGNFVLPIPLLAEGDGTLTNCEGRIQRLRSAIAPKGESRNLREVLAELSDKLGYSLSFASDGDTRKEISKNIPGYQKIASETDLDSLEGISLPRPPRSGTPQETQLVMRSTGEGDKFSLLIPNTLYAWNRNHMIMESPVLKIEYPGDRLAVRICSKDARELRIRLGEKVRLKSERGETEVEMEMDENLPQRTLLVPSHLLSIVEPLTGKGEVDRATRSLQYPNIFVTLEKL